MHLAQVSRRQRISIKCAAVMLTRLVQESEVSKKMIASKMGCSRDYLDDLLTGDKAIKFSEFLDLCFTIDKDPSEVASQFQKDWRKVWAEVEMIEPNDT